MPQRRANLACLLLVAGVCQSADEVSLRVADWAFAGYRGTGLELTVGLTGEQATAILRIEALTGESLGAVRNLDLRCDHFDYDGRLVRCEGARLRVDEIADVGAVAATGSIAFDRKDDGLTVDLTIDGLATSARVVGRLNPDVDVTVRVAQVPLSRVLEGVGAATPESIVLADGALALNVRASETDNGPRLRGSWTLADLSFDSPDGRIAAAALRLEGALDVTLGADRVAFDATVKPRSGEALYDTFYSAFQPEWATSLRARGWFNDGRLQIDEFSLRDGDSLRVGGSLTIAEPETNARLTAATVSVEQANFPLIRQRYLDGLFGAMGLESLTLAGAVSGNVTIADGAPIRAALDADGVDVSHEGSQATLDGLDLKWRWDADGDAPVSSMSWREGRVRAVTLGEARWQFQHAGDHLTLTEAGRLPVLNGALIVDSFAADFTTAGSPQIGFQGRIEPIALGDLTAAFGWPKFGGSVGGEIPGVTWRDGVLRMDGVLRARVFDGVVQVARVALERPFGVAPSFSAELEINGIDLEPLTEAFEFGRITGRLDGYAKGLRLVNWTPVAFDAAVATPRDDRSRRKISQRAVDNLSSLGGGPAGAVSRTFLGVFEEFSYRRIGLSCRLANGVCDMAGAGPSEGGGYLIVQGSGLPRINVVGYQRRVDWRALVSRLAAATAGAGPVVR